MISYTESDGEWGQVTRLRVEDDRPGSEIFIGGVRKPEPKK